MERERTAEIQTPTPAEVAEVTTEIRSAGITMREAEAVCARAADLLAAAVERGLAIGMQPGKIKEEASFFGLGSWALTYADVIIHDKMAQIQHTREEVERVAQVLWTGSTGLWLRSTGS